MQTLHLFATLEAAGLPGLRFISIIAALIFAGIGVYIYRRRHQLFDRDPEITNGQDGHAHRHVRLELVLIVWGALILLMLATLYGIWRA
jgi:ABC-type lipoprotein release transport system permease subunit